MFGLLIAVAMTSDPLNAKGVSAAEPFTTPEQIATKDAAITHCMMEQNVPVMGFNMKVVCLKPSGQIAWVR
jgi:hypothetical protein